MQCARYDVGCCRSCQWLPKPYSRQLAEKQDDLRARLKNEVVEAWLPPVASEQRAMRNKAKMVVSGSDERPLLGMIQRDKIPQDLCDCPLYPASFAPVFATLKIFIARAGLTPYQVVRRRGELKYLLLTGSTNGTMMLRFVLRSEAKLAQLRAALPWLLCQLPMLHVVSANIQPAPMAVLEGEREIPLTEATSLEVCLNDMPLWIQPKSFFQTKSHVAAALYATAREWVAKLDICTMWDLFCGVGGFGLHCARPGLSVTGIEISPEAIACATRSAKQMGLTLRFQALDSSRFANDRQAVPDLVLVNPPRRGIGESLCDRLREMAPRYIIYSSCNSRTLAWDLARLPSCRVVKVQLFDMFPHTGHYEALCLLARQP